MITSAVVAQQIANAPHRNLVLFCPKGSSRAYGILSIHDALSEQRLKRIREAPSEPIESELAVDPAVLAAIVRALPVDHGRCFAGDCTLLCSSDNTARMRCNAKPLQLLSDGASIVQTLDAVVVASFADVLDELLKDMRQQSEAASAIARVVGSAPVPSADVAERSRTHVVLSCFDATLNQWRPCGGFNLGASQQASTRPLPEDLLATVVGASAIQNIEIAVGCTPAQSTGAVPPSSGAPEGEGVDAMTSSLLRLFVDTREDLPKLLETTINSVPQEPVQKLSLCWPMLYSALPLIVPCSDVAPRKALHRALGIPLNEPLLTEGLSLGALDHLTAALPHNSLAFLETLRADLKTRLPSLLTLRPESAKSLEDIRPNEGAPCGILHLVAFPMAVSNSQKRAAAKSELPSTLINLRALPLPRQIPNANRFFVECPLDYYHYLIDGFNDSGWGCAYRSLQLILSWLQRKGIMTRGMPGIREIQEILFRVDPEKQSRKKPFVGSEKYDAYIGSYEVMMVIQACVPALECTLRSMESPKELDENPAIHRLLQTHFERGGCPVMIGGSVYAHSIVGIDVNIRTTQAQYLIVDPHYPSQKPDPAVITQRLWVGWRSASDPKLFDPKSRYNMCIPRVYDLDLS